MGIRNFDNINFTIESYIGLRHNQVHINTLGNPPIIPKERDGLPQGNGVGPVISEQVLDPHIVKYCACLCSISHRQKLDNCEKEYQTWIE